MDTTKDTRTTRGLKLFREHGDEITRVYPHVYRVPSCTGETFYTVHLAPPRAVRLPRLRAPRRAVQTHLWRGDRGEQSPEA